MKKMFELLIGFLFAVFLLSGCVTNTKDETTTTKFREDGKTVLEVVNRVKEEYLATTYKNLNLDISVYAVAASFMDPASSNVSPYIKLGIFQERYRSIPVVPGQPIAVVDEEYSSSWWNWTTFFSGTPDTKTNLIRRTIIYVGVVPDAKKELSVKTGEGTGISIGKDGIAFPGDTAIEFK